MLRDFVTHHATLMYELAGLFVALLAFIGLVLIGILVAISGAALERAVTT